MKPSPIIYLLAIWILSSCNKETHENVDLDEAPNLSTAQEHFDYDKLYSKIDRYDELEHTIFLKDWPALRKEFLLAFKNGELQRLDSVKQQNLWDELAYLHGCHHPTIFLQYGDEIVEILLKLDAPESNSHLRELLDQ